MNFKEFLKAMQTIEDDRKITKEIVIAALQEALAKAYRKHIDIPDVLVRVDINEGNGQIHVYQQYTVVDEVEDEELEVALAEVKDKGYQLGDLVDREVDISQIGRAAALLAKNVMKQKIREAEKQAVYDEYIDQLDEMVTGMIESVEEKFVVVNLGKTMALMPRAAQIPGERYIEGQSIRVVITECNKDTKGAQVLVSRSDAKLVKRLFEKEVPEIYQGVVEIKAIAREAGERTKMAVWSNNPDVDAIGACIGPRGNRVQVVIDELKGEKIDIFEWSDNISELIKNALAPAQILAVLPTEDKRSLLVIVEDNQLSLAIGKKGKNARLAVKLTGMRIDIKTAGEIEEQGIDWKTMMLQFAAEEQKRLAEQRMAKQLEEIEVVSEEAEAETEAEIETPEASEAIEEVEETVAELQQAEAEPEVEVEAEPETVIEEAEIEAETIDEPANEPEVKAEEVKPQAEQPKKEEPVRIKREVRERREYVSRFERLADPTQSATSHTEEKAPLRRRRNVREDDRKLRLKDLKKDKDYEFKPVYSEEELEEIRRQEELEAQNSWIEDDIDFDEFDEYYDEEK
ncbi:transcription termination factor NusA [Holdemania massiliensis]|uniref:Transcription termination/antitermination protein NusA n=1 Tax=Holdemania massiliensis TaxID=1468449 RepID=A0A6N7S611_9FIRM|nr:transcription termination factor NusA [Holdemania massiliensis]MSA71302.1 transcription termination/antitermination protein NusA [Holdemania massiliensis]MSA89209.1 transcription termination/antitermination protein NusA [Holdemania massiliensis]MSB78382.1 transcription termination/antitermination protein NusA [Holdemania massiliensis]MSC33306.1 transcription termination/antitermination protein NusA [Holdemania massiliensis]MSC39284.1 transcription termination/antitermination protein NusA [H